MPAWGVIITSLAVEDKISSSGPEKGVAIPFKNAILSRFGVCTQAFPYAPSHAVCVDHA